MLSGGIGWMVIDVIVGVVILMIVVMIHVIVVIHVIMVIVVAPEAAGECQQ
jgi:hypothetical protein